MNEELLQISIERILAAILRKTGKISIETVELIRDLDGYQVSVEDNEDGSISFEIVESEDES